jgi:hypothetical protein
MLLVQVAVLTIAFVMATALVSLIAKRTKTKPIIPGKAPWIFYLIDQMFGENDSCSKEVKKNEMS